MVKASNMFSVSLTVAHLDEDERRATELLYYAGAARALPQQHQLGRQINPPQQSPARREIRGPMAQQPARVFALQSMTRS